LGSKIISLRDLLKAARFVVPLIKNASSIVWFPMGSIAINGVVFGVTFPLSALISGIIDKANIIPKIRELIFSDIMTLAFFSGRS
jgi:hypothetical protein